MLNECSDLLAEAQEFDALLGRLGEGDWERATPFKDWAVFDVVAHLHLFDRFSIVSLESPERFPAEAERILRALGSGVALTAYTRTELGNPAPQELRRRWLETCGEMCNLLTAAGPHARLRWFGPEMSARTFAAARLMETWAHAQDVYDMLRLQRTYADRIKAIAELGVKTFRWTFANRGLEVPEPPPYVRLVAPSGAIWEWNQPSEANRIEGSAADFCHVVTQGRNVADTQLRLAGETAERWMAIAQCFAGGPSDPPKPGERSWRRPQQ